MNISAIFGIAPAAATRSTRDASAAARPTPTYDALPVPPVTLGGGVETLAASLGITSLELVQRLRSGKGLADLLGADDEVVTRRVSGVLLDGYA